MCSVLAHELRSPLSVLQGYIRLLQRNRDAGHAETAMLDAMLDATGRLTAIARQASDLGAWLGTHESDAFEAVTLTAVLDEVDKRREPAGLTVRRPTELPAAVIRADAGALASALIALAEWLARESGAAVEVSTSPATGEGTVGFRLRAQPTHDVAPRASALRVAFDAGGAGLALVAASHILDAHGAAVDAADSPAVVDVRFRTAGGVQ